jgi:hypothetical protein
LPTTPTSPKAERAHAKAFLEAWRQLHSFGLVSFNANDTDYRYWERACIDLTPYELQHGAMAAKDFKGSFFRVNDYRLLCRQVRPIVPDVYSAYHEACTATRPKELHRWSHPAVFHAGKACGWTFLESTREDTALPRFKAYYREMEKRVLAGEALDVPVVEMIEHKPHVVASPDSVNYRRFKARMGHFGFHD